jgi:hypothetical protein
MMFAALWQNLRQVHGSFAPRPEDPEELQLPHSGASFDRGQLVVA